METYYYNLDTIKKFVIGIIETVDKINKENNLMLEVILKTKRPKHSSYSEEYFLFLNKLTLKYSFFSIVDSQTNIFRLIKEALVTFSEFKSNLVISSANLRLLNLEFSSHKFRSLLNL